MTELEKIVRECGWDPETDDEKTVEDAAVLLLREYQIGVEKLLEVLTPEQKMQFGEWVGERVARGAGLGVR